MRFKDKVVLVFGGNSGMGLAAAKALAAEGARFTSPGATRRQSTRRWPIFPGAAGIARILLMSLRPMRW